MINRSGFVPVLHQTLEEYYRVPVWMEERDRTYTVCVAENVHRYYNDKTVPEKVKALITMVNAFPFVPQDEFSSLLSVTAYSCPDPRQLEIGWRVTKPLYILVMELALLEMMYITGASNGRHAGAQSKEESR